MVRKLGGDDDAFISYRTANYKLHFYETPANLRFVLLTDTGTLSMRNVMHQIYINLWVEYGKWPRCCQYDPSSRDPEPLLTLPRLFSLQSSRTHYRPSSTREVLASRMSSSS